MLNVNKAPKSVVKVFRKSFKKIKIEKIKYVDLGCKSCYLVFAKIKKNKKTKHGVIYISPFALGVEYKDYCIHTNVVPESAGFYEYPYYFKDEGFFDCLFELLYGLEDSGFEGVKYCPDHYFDIIADLGMKYEESLYREGEH